MHRLHPYEPAGAMIEKKMIASTDSTESNRKQSNIRIALICAVLAVGIFVVDVASLPLGVAAGVAYVVVVLIALWLPKWQHTLAVAIGVSILTIVGFLLSEPAGIPWMVVTNRMLALSAIWLIAIGGSWLVFARRNKTEESLRKAEMEVDRARNAKSRFLETSSNDIRHHLQTLILLNGALQRLTDQEKTRDIADKQAEALARLSDLMNSLLDISELQSGDVEPKITETPIDPILMQLKDEFDHQASAKNLQLSFTSHGEVLLSDTVLLTRIIRILISNAIRYTTQGRITVSCHAEPDGLRLSVEDTGIGIAADQIDRIFDEFYQVENDPAGRDRGLGLGLSIVDHSAGLLGTKAEVTSVPGRGSTFSMLLPQV